MDEKNKNSYANFNEELTCKMISELQLELKEVLFEDDNISSFKKIIFIQGTLYIVSMLLASVNINENDKNKYFNEIISVANEWYKNMNSKNDNFNMMMFN